MCLNNSARQLASVNRRTQVYSSSLVCLGPQTESGTDRLAELRVFFAFVQKLGSPDEHWVGGKHGQERLDGMENVGLEAAVPKHTKDWTQWAFFFFFMIFFLSQQSAMWMRRH